MPQEIILTVGDTIEYSNGQKGLIEKIRIIFSGKLVEKYELALIIIKNIFLWA